jgi:hypothetical protein
MSEYRYEQIMKEKRSWKERLFTRPWKPWEKTKDVTYRFGLDTGNPVDIPTMVKMHLDDSGILHVDSVEHFG